MVLLKLKMNQKAQASALLWFFRFFLIALVGLGLIGVVAKYNGIEINRKPIEASVLIDLIIGCYDENLNSCINFDENIFVKYGKQVYGNENLKVLCEVKEKGVKLKRDIYCKETKIFDKKTKSFIDVFIAIA